MKEKDILYERGDYWVLKTAKGTYEVYRNGTTHSTRCAIIGYPGEDGLKRAIAVANQRNESAIRDRSNS